MKYFIEKFTKFRILYKGEVHDLMKSQNSKYTNMIFKGILTQNKFTCVIEIFEFFGKMN